MVIQLQVKNSQHRIELLDFVLAQKDWIWFFERGLERAFSVAHNLTWSLILDLKKLLHTARITDWMILAAGTEIDYVKFKNRIDYEILLIQ